MRWALPGAPAWWRWRQEPQFIRQHAPRPAHGRDSGTIAPLHRCPENLSKEPVPRFPGPHRSTAMPCAFMEFALSTPPADVTQPPVDYAAYLARQLAVRKNSSTVASYRLGDEQVWVKNQHAPWHGALPGAGCAGHAVWSAGADPGAQPGRPHRHCPPKCSGCGLAARGLRVPTDAGSAGRRFHHAPPGACRQEQTPSLGNEIGAAVPAGPRPCCACGCRGLRAIGWCTTRAPA